MTPEHPSDPELRTLTLPSGPATYTDEGSGPTVLAIHGLPGSVRDWRWLGSALDGRVRLVRIDMPGFGGTPLSTSPSAKLADRADFVASVVDALELDRPLVLGHSMGGPVATSLAVRRPDALRALGLLASVAHRPHQMIRGVPRGALAATFRLPGVSRLFAGPLERAYEGFGFRHTTPVGRHHALQCVGALRFPEHAANLAAVRVPTLVAWTEDDPLVEKAVSEELYWRVATGPRVRFPDGGHNLQKSRAVELADTLVAWSEQLWAPWEGSPPSER